MKNIFSVIFTLFSILIRDSSAMEVMPCHDESIIRKMNYLHVGSFNNHTGGNINLVLLCDIHISEDYNPHVPGVVLLKESLSHIYLLLNDQLVSNVAPKCLQRVDYDLKKLTFAKLFEWKIADSKLEIKNDFSLSQFSIQSSTLKFNRLMPDHQLITLNLDCKGLLFHLYPLDIPEDNNYLERGIRICSQLQFNDFKDIFNKDESSLFSLFPKDLIGVIVSILMSLNTVDPTVCYTGSDHWDDFSYADSEDDTDEVEEVPEDNRHDLGDENAFDNKENMI